MLLFFNCNHWTGLKGRERGAKKLIKFNDKIKVNLINLIITLPATCLVYLQVTVAISWEYKLLIIIIIIIIIIRKLLNPLKDDDDDDQGWRWWLRWRLSWWWWWWKRQNQFPFSSFLLYLLIFFLILILLENFFFRKICQPLIFLFLLPVITFHLHNIIFTFVCLSTNCPSSYPSYSREKYQFHLPLNSVRLINSNLLFYHFIWPIDWPTIMTIIIINYLFLS